MAESDKRNAKNAASLTGVFFVILYALFPTKMHFIDGLLYAWNLENFPLEYQWHQHHPLWLPMMHILFHGVKVILPGLRSMAFLSFINAILGGLIIYLFIRLVDSIIRNRFASVLAGIFLGFSWGMMNYSTDSNIYMTVIVLMMVSFLFLLRADEVSRGDAFKSTSLVLLASLMHQMAFFFTLPVLVGILIRTPRGRKFKTALGCTLLYSLVVVAVNYAVFMIAKPLVDIELQTNFWQWLTVYGSDKQWWTMLDKGFMWSELVFAYTQFNLFFHTYECELLNHARNVDLTKIHPGFIVFYIIVILTILYEIFSVIVDRKSEFKNRQIRIILLVWFLPYFLFNQVYCAYEVHYKLFYLIPLLALWTLRLNRASTRIRIPLAVILSILALFLGVWNFTTGMYPNKNPDHNPFLKNVLDLKDVVKKGDLVIFSRQEYYNALLARYYTDADTVPFRMQYGRFTVVGEGFLAVDQKTIEYFKSHYKRIFLTDHADENKPRQWYFSGHFFRPPHPWLLGIHPSSIEETGTISTPGGQILHEVALLPAVRFRHDYSPEELKNLFKGNDQNQ